MQDECYKGWAVVSGSTAWIAVCTSRRRVNHAPFNLVKSNASLLERWDHSRGASLPRIHHPRGHAAEEN